MEEFLFLFHSTVGVVQTRKLLQASGVSFRVADIPAPCAAAAGYAFACSAHPVPNSSGCCPARPRRFTAAREKRLSRWRCMSRRPDKALALPSGSALPRSSAMMPFFSYQEAR
jgi:hypothetical protein